MKIPPRLLPLVEDGIVDEVLGQVKSGKEAEVFLVRIGEDIRCAKVYKDANVRSFRQAVQYQEGRKTQNSRSARAMSKRTNYGQKQAEKSWITAEVDALNLLSSKGIRVPKPFGFYDGVLIMELIADENGDPAPRLNDVELSADMALDYHEIIIADIVRMLCAGLIHGDLSEFNVLVDTEGPVIIDLPQAVNAAGNNSAAMMFARDVNNMSRYFGRFEPGILTLKYAKEIWALYEKGKLTPDVELTGQYQEPKKQVDVGGVLNAIGDARKEHEFRQQRKNRIYDPDAPRETWQARGTLGDTQGAGQRNGAKPDQAGHTPRQGDRKYPPRPGHANPNPSANRNQGQGNQGSGHPKNRYPDRGNQPGNRQGNQGQKSGHAGNSAPGGHGQGRSERQGGPGYAPKPPASPSAPEKESWGRRHHPRGPRNPGV